MIKGETAMNSTNRGHTLDTIKGHGIKLGDRFTFHGMASDPIPTVEGTRVAFMGKVGTKYMIGTVTGDVHTWEFGPSAKVWADTSVTHHVTIEARTLDNGDTVYTGHCEHGWMTGFHLTESDARDVATGHGEASRPLYVAPKPVEDMTEAEIVATAQDAIRQNGRVFVAEAHNWGGQAAFDALVASGWATLVDDGDMSRYIRTMRTADRIVITDGLAVWDYNLTPGRVVLSTAVGDGWFNVETINGGHSLMNGERVTTRHPRTRQAAGDVVAAMTRSFGQTVAVFTEDATVIVSPGDTVYRERDGAQGVVRDVLTSGEVDVAFPGGAGMVRTPIELIAEGFEVISDDEIEPCCNGRVWDKIEAQVWAGTDTLTRPNRTKANKRKRKANKVNARRVKGGF